MAYDAFMTIKGLPGETKDKQLADSIEIFSFSWGASNPVNISGSGMSAGKASYSSFNLMKRADKASTKLLEALTFGTHLPEVDVVLRKATGAKGTPQKPFIQYKFKECMIESLQWSGSAGGDDVPTESLSISFASLQYSYFAQDAEGTVSLANEFQYDLKAQAAGA